jgi:hypothetical protein
MVSASRPGAVRRSPPPSAVRSCRRQPLSPGSRPRSRSWQRHGPGVARPLSRASVQTPPATGRAGRRRSPASRPGAVAVAVRRPPSAVRCCRRQPPSPGSRPRSRSWQQRHGQGVERPPSERQPRQRQPPSAPNEQEATRAALVPFAVPLRRALLPQAAGALTNPAPEPARGSGVTAPVRGAAAVAVDASARTAPPITERPERCMISASRVVGAVRSLDTDDASPLPRAGRGARDS